MNHGISTKAPSERFILKVAATLICVVVADFLMFDEHIGWTMGLFGFTVLCCVTVCNQKLLRSKVAIFLTILVFGQCLLMIERASFLSFVLAFVGLIFLALSGWRDIAKDKLAALYYFKNIFFTPVVLLSAKHAAARQQPKIKSGNLVRGWVLPVGLSTIFLFFFSSANPVLANFFSAIDLKFILDFMKPGRWFVWLLVGIPTFHLIRFRVMAKKKHRRPLRAGNYALFFTKDAVIRSLVAFNIIFLFQTVSDVMYLWGGWSLPEGITYAEYAHKGAYPLIVTALLAGIFVMLTNRAGEEVSSHPLVKKLIYLWLAQNILLVFSSMFRTVLYVEHYSLTYLRIAALIWMLLVAGGLLILILRLHYRRNENWMLNRIIIMLFSILYLASFPNYASFIANYNYMHSKQVTGEGTLLDLEYLRYFSDTGEAFLVFEKVVNDDRFSNMDKRQARNFMRDMLPYYELQRKNWRSWTYRDHRLQKKLNQADLRNRFQSVYDPSYWRYDN